MSGSPGAGEKLFLECLHDARDELRELMERWNHRLVTKGDFSLREAYLKGHITIALELEIAGEGGRSHLSRFSPKGAEREGSLLSLVSNEGYGRDRICGDEESMFVGIVEFVEAAQRVVPSLAWVRPYLIHNQIDNVGASQLYRSVVDSLYKLIPRLPHRKFRALRMSPMSLS